MRVKIYFILTCIVLLFPLSTIHAQTDVDDAELVRSLNDGELRKMENDKSPVLYVGKLLVWDWLRKKLAEEKTFGSGKDTIRLSDEDKQSLMAQIDVNEQYTWPEHFLSNGTRVVVNSEMEYEAMLKEEQQKAPANNHGYVYIFSKPLYIRGGTMALVGFGKMCGTDCNRNEEVAFYRKENDHWKKAVVICKRKKESGACIKQNIAQK